LTLNRSRIDSLPELFRWDLSSLRFDLFSFDSERRVEIVMKRSALQLFCGKLSQLGGLLSRFGSMTSPTKSGISQTHTALSLLCNECMLGLVLGETDSILVRTSLSFGYRDYLAGTFRETSFKVAAEKATIDVIQKYNAELKERALLESHFELELVGDSATGKTTSIYLSVPSQLHFLILVSDVLLLRQLIAALKSETSPNQVDSRPPKTAELTARWESVKFEVLEGNTDTIPLLLFQLFEPKVLYRIQDRALTLQTGLEVGSFRKDLSCWESFLEPLWFKITIFQRNTSDQIISVSCVNQMHINFNFSKNSKVLDSLAGLAVAWKSGICNRTLLRDVRIVNELDCYVNFFRSLEDRTVICDVAPSSQKECFAVHDLLFFPYDSNTRCDPLRCDFSQTGLFNVHSLTFDSDGQLGNAKVISSVEEKEGLFVITLMPHLWVNNSSNYDVTLIGHHQSVVIPSQSQKPVPTFFLHQAKHSTNLFVSIPSSARSLLCQVSEVISSSNLGPRSFEIEFENTNHAFFSLTGFKDPQKGSYVLCIEPFVTVMNQLPRCVDFRFDSDEFKYEYAGRVDSLGVMSVCD
jgi:hypothetical protein